MKVLSYGGGVQTLALGRMILNGLFERPDLVVFADTQRERGKTYQAIQREFALFNSYGIEAVIVTGGDLGSYGGKMLPLYTIKNDTGERGRLRTVCSPRFKTEVINRELRRRGAKKAEVWLGLSVDEVHRLKPNPRKWLTNRWPLIEMQMRRGDCEEYLKKLDIEPVKSACVFCPNASSKSALAALEPHELQYAITFDETVRNLRPGYKSYVHASCKPLATVVAENAHNIDLFDYDPKQDECSGVCFV